MYHTYLIIILIYVSVYTLEWHFKLFVNFLSLSVLWHVTSSVLKLDDKIFSVKKKYIYIFLIWTRIMQREFEFTGNLTWKLRLIHLLLWSNLHFLWSHFKLHWARQKLFLKIWNTFPYNECQNTHDFFNLLVF